MRTGDTSRQEYVAIQLTEQTILRYMVVGCLRLESSGSAGGIESIGRPDLQGVIMGT